ncbi:MAG: YmdB family metallophosphoesterase [Alphaproteobacteria bacterium]|nr:YmdB family metallophosphoesterase [Alphaproteobacteria bacterium]
MRILFLGDIMGRSGREAVLSRVGGLRRDLGLDFVVANGENAAGGFGVTPDLAREILSGGVDVLTGGNHSWDKREIIPFMEEEPRILRPVNLPARTPGRGLGVYRTGSGAVVVVINVMTRLFMELSDDPFAAVDGCLESWRLGREAAVIVVDVHGEATSEKAALAHHLDGRASLVVGTHTHVPTADERILRGGTAFQSDAGMCGDYDSVIGMETELAVERFRRRALSRRAEVSRGEGTLCGLVADVDDGTGLATGVERVALGGVLDKNN